ncbi:hypothetical protein M3Y98_00772200 [Aphelenchoides besseyi]|nr:hypothetical protein M3Y98_00772200 [Aphelenchoides besseyi]
MQSILILIALLIPAVVVGKSAKFIGYPRPCEDQEKDCQPRYPEICNDDYSASYCKATCGLCGGKRACYDVEKNYPEICNDQYSASYCRATCGLCGGKRACYDVEENCSPTMCNTQSALYCKATCGMCNN